MTVRTLLSFSSLAYVALLIAAGSAPALADGGLLRVSERQGKHQLFVFTAPNPLRAGPADISFLLQDLETGQPPGEFQVFVTLTPPGGVSPSHFVIATQAAATNKLMRAALVELSPAGQWQADIRCVASGETISTRFVMDVGPPLPRWLTLWPWFSWPLAAVLLFGAHRRIVARSARSAHSIRHHREPPRS